MLVEIHMLQNHVPSNINRDDLGAPKTTIFGGVTRARISSQCIKRSIRGARNPDDPTQTIGHFQESLPGLIGIRTKIFPYLVGEALKKLRAEGKCGIPEKDPNGGSVDQQIMAACCSIAKAENSSTKKGKDERDDRPKTPQLIFLGPQEAEEFAKRLDRCRKEMEKEFEHFLNPVATYQDLVQQLLEEREIPSKEHSKIVKAAWNWGQQKPWRRGEETAAESETSSVLNLDDAKAYLDWLFEMNDDERQAKLMKPKKGEADAWMDYAKPKTLKMNDFNAALRGTAPENAVDISLFGRMTTSDAFENIEAAMSVAHAISTNAVASNEVDYFTAVDDLGRGTGAGHLGEIQFNSATYYKHFSLDWEDFIANLAGSSPTNEQKISSRMIAGRAIKAFIEAAMFSSPSGKRNSFAHNNIPDGVLIEVKKKNIPTNYANAFLSPAAPTVEEDLMENSIRKLDHYVGSVAEKYEIDGARFWFTTRAEVPFKSGVEKKRLSDLIEAVLLSIGFSNGEIGNITKTKIGAGL